MIMETKGSGLLDPVLNARAESMHDPTTSGYCLSRFGRRLNPSYTSGICGDGYIAFVFLFVRSHVRSFLLPSVAFVEFTTQFFKWCISQQRLTRKHSYLDHSFPGGLALTP